MSTETMSYKQAVRTSAIRNMFVKKLKTSSKRHTPAKHRHCSNAIHPLSLPLKMENWGNHSYSPCCLCGLQTEKGDKYRHNKATLCKWLMSVTTDVLGMNAMLFKF